MQGKQDVGIFFSNMQSSMCITMNADMQAAPTVQTAPTVQSLRAITCYRSTHATQVIHMRNARRTGMQVGASGQSPQEHLKAESQQAGMLSFMAAMPAGVFCCPGKSI